MNLTADGVADDRGVAPVLAVVLLFGLVLFAATMTAVAGMSLIDAMQTQSSVDQAESSMQQVRSELTDLSSSTESNRTDLELSGGSESRSAVVDDGTMSFRINEGSSDECPRTATLDVGTLEYEEGDRTVGFQAGGVWGTTDGVPTTVAPPGLRYDTVSRNGVTVYAIDFPVTNVDPDASTATGGTIDARHNRTLTQERQEELRENLCLPPGDEIDRVRNVTIRIEDNRYADAWARFLESELMVDGVPENDVTVQPNGTVVARAKLGGPEPDPDTVVDDVDPEAGAHGTSTSGRLQTQPHTTVDGYNSSQATYAATADRERGTVVSATNVRVQPNARVEGDVVSAGSITELGTVTNETREYRTVSTLEAIDDDVEDAIDAAADDNDNGNTTTIQSRALAGGSMTLSEGVYYVDDLDLDAGETLELDTSGGDVVIAVDDDVELDGHLSVVGGGDGRARLFATDDVTVDEDVTVTGDRAPKNVWYGSSDAEVEIAADRHTGLVYAPNATIDITGGAGGGGGPPGGGGGPPGGGGSPTGTQIFGAVTGDIDQIGTHAEIHYDVAIESTDFSGSSGSGPGGAGGSSGGWSVGYGDAVSISSEQIELRSD